jgi:hypothetical protein
VATIALIGNPNRLPLKRASIALNRQCRSQQRHGRPSFWERPSRALPDPKGAAAVDLNSRPARARDCQHREPASAVLHCPPVIHDLVTAFLVAFAAVTASELLTRIWDYF